MGWVNLASFIFPQPPPGNTAAYLPQLSQLAAGLLIAIPTETGGNAFNAQNMMRSIFIKPHDCP